MDRGCRALAPALSEWPAYPGPGWFWALGVVTQRSSTASPAPAVDCSPAWKAVRPTAAGTLSAELGAAGCAVVAVGDRPRWWAAARVRRRRPKVPPPALCVAARPRGAGAADGLGECLRPRTSRSGLLRRSGCCRRVDRPRCLERGKAAQPPAGLPGLERRPGWAEPAGPAVADGRRSGPPPTTREPGPAPLGPVAGALRR
jgi:hypothetical protein